MLTRDQNNTFSCTEISPPSSLKRLYSQSMCLVNSKFVYVTGGALPNSVSNCRRYDTDRNLWQEIQSMNQVRREHSSCQLGGHIYVFGGFYSETGKDYWPVEKLPIADDPNIQAQKQWEVIPDLTALPDLFKRFSIPLNANEIVILGGYEEKVFLYDCRTDSC